MANTRKQKFREKAATEFVTIVQKGSGPRYKCLGPTATEEATSKPIAPDNIIANQGSRRRQDTAAMEGSGVAPKSTVAPANFKVKAQDNEAKDNTTKEKANLETPAPTTHAPNDPKWRASWVERYGRALMSDRSPDHVGLPYFEGYPWDKPDAEVGGGKQSGQKDDKREEKKENKKADKAGGKETETTYFESEFPPW